MTIVIPTWLLWALGAVIGIPLTVAIILFAAFGFAMAKDFWRWP